MADDTKRAYAQSAQGEPHPGWGEPSLGGGGQRESVGERLRRERETYGLHLREVSESLRIRYAYLDAIERSAFDELPGPTYAVGFVRGYAQFLGLDDDRIVQRFKEESQGLKRDQELHFPEPVNEGKIPGGTILVLSIVLVAVAYGAWAYLSDGERSVADLVPEVPESLQRMVGATEQPPVPEATDLGSDSADTPAAGTEDRGQDGLETEQVADLPETAPEPDVSGERANATADEAPLESPDSGGGRSEGRGANAAAPSEAPETTGDAADAADGGSSQTASETGEGRTIPQAPDQTASAAGDSGESAPALGGDGEIDLPDAPSTNGDTAQAAADTASSNPAPPEVPEMQQDDSGIPTAPQQTQSASADTQGDDGRTFGASTANSRVTLIATARSWVQVRGPDDSLVLTRLLRPGDRYNVPDRPGLTLHTGNAGGLQVMVDGQEIGTLGVDGEVRRGILLEPQALGTTGG